MKLNAKHAGNWIKRREKIRKIEIDKNFGEFVYLICHVKHGGGAGQ